MNCPRGYNLYIYKTKAYEAPTIFHVSIYLFIFLFFKFHFFFYFLNFAFFKKKKLFYFFSVFYATHSFTLSNLYAFLKPKTLTFELSLSLSLRFTLGSAVSPFTLYSSNLSLTSHPHSLSLKLYLNLLCSLFTDFGVFSGNLYDFTLDLKFSAFFH